MPGGLALQVRLSTDTTIQQRASVDQSFDFDLSNTGTIRLLRESCGEVNINAEGIQIKGRGRSAGRGRSGSPSDAHYKVSARDICEFQVIGAGASSQVRKAVDLRSNSFVALKVMSVMDKSKRHQLLNEVRTLCEAEHSGALVNFHGAFFNKETSQITVVLEYMDAGSLVNVLQRAGSLPEPVLGRVATQVLEGLAFLHTQRHTMHRDIKPGNILLNYQGKAKVSDFGITAGLESTLAVRFSYIGTMCYMSPERINNHPYTAEADIWSLGLTLFEAAMGQYPYCTTQGPVNLCIEITEYPSPELPADRFSPELCDLVARCLEKDPKQRLTAEQLLSHPFIMRYRDAGDAEVAALLQSLVEPDELLTSYAQLFAANYYCLLDARADGLHALGALYKDASLLTVGARRHQGATAAAAALAQHSAQLVAAAVGGGGGGGDAALWHHHKVQRVDAQPHGEGGMVVYIEGHIDIMNAQLPEAHQGGRMQSTAFGECFLLVQSAPHVPGEHYIANQIRQLREGPS